MDERLNKRRDAEIPSHPGAELGLRDWWAASNSQSETDGQPERVVLSAMSAFSRTSRWSWLVEDSSGKKCLAQPSMMMLGSEESEPLIIMELGSWMDLAFPENLARALKVSPAVASDLKTSHDLALAERIAR